MSQKPKFKPVITRVKLNPEQAVLACEGFNTNRKKGGIASNWYCTISPKGTAYGSCTYIGTTSS